MKNQFFPGSNDSKILQASRYFLTGLRISAGWLFLYEGVSKLIVTNWSSASYLLESQWIFSDVFHWMASNQSILNIVDFINIWGLILIGLALFFGIFTRLASIFGAFFIFLYFIANPPLIGFIGESTGEGNYLVVNKNLILIFLLILMSFIPNRMFFGLDRLFQRLKKRDENHYLPDKPIESKGRREMIKDLISVPLFGGFAYAVASKNQWESFEERNLISEPSRVDAVTGASPSVLNFANLNDLKGEVPKGKIGNFEISRMICGGNLISGYAHSRDLIYVSSLVQAYFSDEKVLETMRLCEACGINTIILRVDKNTLRLMEKYRKRDGKMHWIAQCKITNEDFKADIDAAVDNGAMSAYIHGGIADDFVAGGKIDKLWNAVEYIRRTQNVLAGIAAHDIRVIMACEENAFNVDYYMKTLNSGNYWTAGPKLITDAEWKPDPYVVVEPEYGKNLHDNIWATTPEQTIEVMRNVKKPWISYKVLGAGAIHPRDGFRYAFENGADFACVGMFDFQIIENANILNELQVEDLGRSRSWMA